MGSQGWEGWLAGSRGGVSAAGEDRVELPVEAHRRLASLVAEQPLDGLERIGVAVEVELRHEMAELVRTTLTPPLLPASQPSQPCEPIAPPRPRQASSRSFSRWHDRWCRGCPSPDPSTAS